MAKELDTLEKVQQDLKRLKQQVSSGLISYSLYISQKRIVKARLRELQGVR